MKKAIILNLLLGALLIACTKKEIPVDKNNLILGVWTFSHSDLDVNVFSRSGEFTQAHCYRFNSDGTLVERNLAGWCGTPPVSYSDYQGSWSAESDSLILIDAGYWGGTRTYRLKIVQVSADSLKMIQME